MTNPFDLTGKVALVTGGNGGIGLGISRGLARAGAKVAILGRKPEKTRDAAAQVKAEFGVETLAIVADVTVPADAERAIAEVLAAFGRLDILVNNAGINIRKQPQDLTVDDWHQVLEINLSSVFLLSKAAYPSLKAAGGGKIINIGSMTSIFGASFASAYAATKGGVVQFTKSLALAWAADRIQVNAILPGWFDTELTQGARRQIEGMHEKVLAKIPAGHWGHPDEIAGTAVWLASSASDYVTGVAVPVDGGFSSTMI